MSPYSVLLHSSSFQAIPPPFLSFLHLLQITTDHNVIYVTYAFTSTVYLNFMQCLYLVVVSLLYLKTNFPIHYLTTKMRWEVCSIFKELVVRLERQEHISVTFAVSLVSDHLLDVISDKHP